MLTKWQLWHVQTNQIQLDIKLIKILHPPQPDQKMFKV